MTRRAQLIRETQRAQAMYLTVYLWKSEEKEYLAVMQGLADTYCELQILAGLLEALNAAR